MRNERVRGSTQFEIRMVARDLPWTPARVPSPIEAALFAFIKITRGKE